MVIIYTKSLQRQLSHLRFLFLLIIVLNTLQTKDHTTQIIHRKHFERDLQYCHKCFEYQIQHCFQVFKQIKPDDELSMRQLLTFLHVRSCKRNNQLVKLKNSPVKVMAKYLNKQNQKYENIYDIDILKRDFLKQQQILQGMQYAPLYALDNFIEILEKFHSNLSKSTIYHYLLNNIQPLLNPLLTRQNFPIPKTYAVCGFTLFQQYVGQDLYNFFKIDFSTKVKISQQLLQAALKFSYGFNSYRLYITDFTADNIVYDHINNKLNIIDLDTLFIVDSAKAKYKSSIHKHQYIECPGCFAYSADDIASYNISDINVYLACKFLREDLFKDQTKGFLFPIPLEVNSKYPKLRQLLNKCVDCPDTMCWERFMVAKDLIKLLGDIIREDV